MAYLDRSGIRLHYEVSGIHNEALPLLLTHGYGASSRMWDPNVAALAADRRVISWDLRGHGRSDCPDDPARYSQDACLDDMIAILDAAGASRAVLGGLSLGGYLSLAFCLAHPERVAGLILCDTGPGYRNDEARQRWNDRAVATASRLERDGLAALGPARTPDAGQWSARGLALAARGMLTQRDGRVIESLRSIEVPTLVLVGADDAPFLAAADYVAARIPGAVHAVIPDAGHMCNLDQPEQFNRQVAAFLGRLGGG